MKFTRSSGIILHPTSLPGPDGIGDLGPEAYRWVNFLKRTGCGLWQVLPLSPTGYGDSPYQSFSAFAGNPYLISPTLLLDDDLLTAADLVDRPNLPAEQVDYGPVIQWKLKVLDRAFEHFKSEAPAELKQQLSQFQAGQASWLEDFALFMAIKESQGMISWEGWPMPLRTREAGALNKFRQENAEAIERTIFRQFLFYRQWENLHKYTNDQGIKIIGDIPIFVAFDSADAWSHPELFFMDEERKPTFVAGVPPDYFSATGQLWGNPIYKWDVHKQTGYAWWIERIRATLKLFDAIRLDHFRGFAGYWEIPAGSPTAETGQWKPGPGVSLFEAIRAALQDLPIIAEDLGEITPDVIELRDTLGLPGMKVLQFAFQTDAHDPFLPHNYPRNCVAYTGTHDNDTTTGWYRTAMEKEKDMARRYLARPGDDIAWDFIRLAWSSVANFTLAPMQDFLSLGTEARMNQPGRLGGNWSWRMKESVLTDETLINRIHEANLLYGRMLGEEVEDPGKVIKITPKAKDMLEAK
ncbi:MAG TPA: 4-alpha-glucanotransferase [Anaerolineaceae bacterium]